MKKLFLIPIFSLFFCACASNNSPRVAFSSLNPSTDITVKPSTTSYELYSWQTPSKTWAFSLLENGANITSSFEDISTNANTIIGLPALKQKLTIFPRGTKIYWNLKRIKGCSLPDEQIQTQILQDAKKLGITIEVIPWL